MWFLAVMCGAEGKTIHVPLSFLGSGRYNASLVRDNKENDAAVVGGGFVGRFSK
jgi:hypothetical protein